MSDPQLKRFVCLDTNILIRYCTQATPGFEPDLFSAFTSHVRHGHVTLLLPEVVLLEFNKESRLFASHFNSQIEKVNGLVRATILDERNRKDEKNKIWNELGTIEDAIVKHNLEWKSQRLEGVLRREQEVRSLLEMKEVVGLPLTSEVLLRLRKRKLNGTLPEKQSDPDCWLIESMVMYFERNQNGNELAFCTENLQDFGVVSIKEKRTRTVDPTLQNGLPPTEVFVNLKELIDFVDSRRDIVQLPPEQIAKAVDQRDELSGLLTDASAMIDDWSSLSAIERLVERLSPNSRFRPLIDTLSKPMPPRPSLLTRRMWALDPRHRTEDAVMEAIVSDLLMGESSVEDAANAVEATIASQAEGQSDQVKQELTADQPPEASPETTQ